MLGQASFLAWAGPGQLWQGQASLGQVGPAQAGLGWPEQDIFLHGNLPIYIIFFSTTSDAKRKQKKGQKRNCYT